MNNYYYIFNINNRINNFRHCNNFNKSPLKKPLKTEKKDPLLSVDLTQSPPRFFLIAIIFLIFDVETALILPMTIIPFNSNIIICSVTSILFLVILTVGLYHEWNQGSLEWAS